MTDDEVEPVIRETDWGVRASARLVQAATAVAKEKGPSAQQLRGPVNYIAEYRRAVAALAVPGKLSREERRNLERTVARLRNKLEFGPERKPSRLKVPGRSKSDHRAFERWLVEACERRDFVPPNFGFWCLAKLSGDTAIASAAVVRRVDLLSLGFSQKFVSNATQIADDPRAITAPTFSPAQFLSAASGVHLSRIMAALEVPADFSDDELDWCIAACEDWDMYKEPGAANSDAIVRALFEEMNSRGIGKDELAKSSGVAEKTLDTWNHTDADKRSPPKLSKIAAALEAVGLRLMAIPEADVAEVRMLLKQLGRQHEKDAD